METHSKESMAKSLSHAAYCRQKYQELPIELKNIKVSWMDSAKRWLQMVKSNRDFNRIVSDFDSEFQKI